MNSRLVDALNRSMWENNSEEIRQLLIEADPELLKIIGDLPTGKIIQLACEYVAAATTEYVYENVNFENLIIGSDINEGLRELAASPAIVNYTHAVMIITAALVKGD